MQVRRLMALGQVAVTLYLLRQLLHQVVVVVDLAAMLGQIEVEQAVAVAEATVPPTKVQTGAQALELQIKVLVAEQDQLVRVGAGLAVAHRLLEQVVQRQLHLWVVERVWLLPSPDLLLPEQLEVV